MTKRHAALFRSAYAAGNLTPEQVLAFHKARYAGVDLRMEGGDEGGDKGENGDKGGGDAGAGGTDKGFPENTPLADMTPEQQVAYWKDKAQKHESRNKSRGDYDQIKAERDRLKAATQTDADKAVDEAKKAGAAEATEKMAGLLVAAEFKAALAGKRKAEEIATLVGGLDTKKFLTDSGEVDTDKVTQFAAGLAPAGGWPDTGQGKTGTTGAAKGVSAGAEMYAAKRGKKTNT